MNGRDENGRFKKGHKGGPGRPKKPKEKPEPLDPKRFHQALRESITDEDAIVIFKKWVDQAKRGNHRARESLLAYLIGKPEQVLALTNASGIRLNWDWEDKETHGDNKRQ